MPALFAAEQISRFDTKIGGLYRHFKLAGNTYLVEGVGLHVTNGCDPEILVAYRSLSTGELFFREISQFHELVVKDPPLHRFTFVRMP